MTANNHKMSDLFSYQIIAQQERGGPSEENCAPYYQVCLKRYPLKKHAQQNYLTVNI